MKIRNSFVTNSSSSSFVISNNLEYHLPLSKELIKECLDDIFKTYCNVTNKRLRKDINSNFFEYLPERIKDYNIFEKGETKEIADAFHNECWSASGIYIPDEIHKILKKANSTEFYGAPSKQDIKNAQKELEKLCKENNIDSKEIFNIDRYGTDEYDYNYDYYDFEFQQALRGDFVIITGENAFPYETFELIESILSASRYHLG